MILSITAQRIPPRNSTGQELISTRRIANCAFHLRSVYNRQKVLNFACVKEITLQMYPSNVKKNDKGATFFCRICG